MPGVEDVGAGLELEHLEVFSQGALVADRQSEIVYVSQKAAGILGVRPELLLGRQLPQAVFSTGHEEAFREISGQVLSGVSWRGELDAVRADDLVVRVEVTCAPLRRHGEVTGIVCAISDTGGSPPDQGRGVRLLAD